MSALDSLKAGTRVKILDTSADCPKGEGVIVADMSLTSEEYEVEYSNGAGTVYGLFYRSELEPLDTCDIPDPIPRRDLVQAVLDGKTVQFQRSGEDDWRDLPSPKGALICILMERSAVRLKPEPVVRYLAMATATDRTKVRMGRPHDTRSSADLPTWQKPEKILVLEIDPDTLDVITAKTEAP